MTDGAFDITVFPLMELWGFYDKNHTVPDEASIKDILKLVGYDKIGLEGNMLNLQSGTKIDLGAVTKGFAGQKTAAMLIDSGVKSGMLSLGGNIQLFGLNPDKSVWNIAVQDPKDEHSYIGIIHDTDCSIITSGCYQRYFEKDNKIYHHILNPHTGYPADSGILSVTVVANDGTYADALSTALFVTGLDKAVEIWREYGDFEAIFVTEDKHVYITEGLKDKFTPYFCQDKTDTYLYIYINK
jgi:thiamine biosynthesis lipoprotein